MYTELGSPFNRPELIVSRRIHDVCNWYGIWLTLNTKPFRFCHQNTILVFLKNLTYQNWWTKVNTICTSFISFLVVTPNTSMTLEMLIFFSQFWGQHVNTSAFFPATWNSLAINPLFVISTSRLGKYDGSKLISSTNVTWCFWNQQVFSAFHVAPKSADDIDSKCHRWSRKSHNYIELYDHHAPSFVMC